MNDYVDELLKQGIDAVWIGGGEKELVAINPKVLIVKDSQLFKVSEGLKGLKKK